MPYKFVWGAVVGDSRKFFALATVFGARLCIKFKILVRRLAGTMVLGPFPLSEMLKRLPSQLEGRMVDSGDSARACCDLSNEKQNWVLRGLSMVTRPSPRPDGKRCFSGCPATRRQWPSIAKRS
jgi:hypothetical protein